MTKEPDSILDQSQKRAEIFGTGPDIFSGPVSRCWSRSYSAYFSRSYLVPCLVNIIPLISKSDTLTPDECQDFKKEILREINLHNIKIYEFPDAIDEEENRYVID